MNTKTYPFETYEYEGELYPIATESDWDSACSATAIEFGPVPPGRLVGQPTKWVLMDGYGDVFAIADVLGGRPEDDEIREAATVYTVLLECGTVGQVHTNGQHPDALLGEEITVHLRDENGAPMQVRGTLKETISSKQEWE